MQATETLAERLKTLQAAMEQAVQQHNGLIQATEQVKSEIHRIQGAIREVREIQKILGDAPNTEAPKLVAVKKDGFGIEVEGSENAV